MDNTKIDTISLWYESDGDNKYSTGDTFITNLIWSGSNIWRSSNANISLPSAQVKIIITASLKSTAAAGDTFQGQIDAFSCSSTVIGTGPQTTITNLYKQTVVTGKKWTFMVYLDGDNNLEGDGISDFIEMAGVGSNDDINIIVQMDRYNGSNNNVETYGDWINTQRFYVTSGMTPIVGSAISDWGDGKGGGREVNMADTQALIDFINWTKTNYPADSYLLVI